MTGTDVENDAVEPKINPDTAAEVPSAAWGWSGESPKAARRAGWVVAFFLLCMLIGNHHGHIEDIFLIGFAAAIVAILIRDIVTRRQDR